MNKKLLIAVTIIVLVFVAIGIAILSTEKATKERTTESKIPNTQLKADIDSLNQNDADLDSIENPEIIEVD
jgi:uncharacterized protein YpmB